MTLFHWDHIWSKPNGDIPLPTNQPMHPLSKVTFMTSLDSSCLHPLSVRIIALLTTPGLPHNHCCHHGNQSTNASYQTLPQINLPPWPWSINLPNAPYQALPWIIVTWPPNHQTPHQCWFQTFRKACVKQLPMTLHLTSLICFRNIYWSQVCLFPTNPRNQSTTEPTNNTLTRNCFLY